jgi:hypothetical protein
MPGGDRTGPMGSGPMTGRGAGYCAGNIRAGYGNFGARAGYGCRGGNQGGGRGWRNWYYATGLTGWQRAGGWQGQAYAAGQAPGFYGPATTREQQLEALKNQAEYMEGTLTDIKRQIETLEAQDRKESK